MIHQEAQGRPIPHNVVPRLFRIGDGAEALTGLGTQAQASYYFAAILGLPGNLFSLMRSNLPVDPAKVESDRWRRAYNAEHFATTLGSLSAQIGYSARPGIDKADFVAYAPQTSAQPSDTSIYSPQTNAKFDFSGPRIPPEQLHFARKLALLTRQHQTKLVVLHLPDITESRANRIHERGSWPQSLETEPALVGIPPAALFAGLTDEEIKKLFFDWCHLNKNGQEYFTPLITPSLLKIYHVETKH